MLPMVAVRLQLGELLAADDTTLAPAANANKIALVISDTEPSEDLEAADLDLATFNGSTPLLGATGTQQVGLDPVTGEQIVTIKDPAGGYRWECGATPGAPETVFGFALFNNDLSTLLAYERLPDPISITAIGQEINIGKATIRIVTEPAS